MEQTQNHTQTIQQNTIDLRELFAVLKRRKKLIWSVTGILTVLAIVYAFLIAKPIYETKAMVELAQINKKPVQNIIDLKQKIEMVFDVNVKNRKIEFPKVTAVNIPKKTNKIFSVVTQGYDNPDAEKKLQEVLSYIKDLANEELSMYTKTQNKRLVLVKEDMTHQIQISKKMKNDIQSYTTKLLSISKQDAALAGIYAIEIGKKQTELNNATKTIYRLKNQINDLELSLSPLKIKKTEIIGKIEVLEKPVKPKKELIVIVAFITGLMLSIFFAFFLEFIGSMKKEEEN